MGHNCPGKIFHSGRGIFLSLGYNSHSNNCNNISTERSTGSLGIPIQSKGTFVSPQTRWPRYDNNNNCHHQNTAPPASAGELQQLQHSGTMLLSVKLFPIPRMPGMAMLPPSLVPATQIHSAVALCSRNNSLGQ